MSSALVADEWFSAMPPFFREMIEIANRATRRDVRMYHRVYHGALRLMFRSVPQEDRHKAALVSTMGVVICAYADYWADTAARLDLVDEAAAHVLSGAPARSDDVRATAEVWRKYVEIIGEGAMFASVRELLFHELGLLFESMRHAVLVNREDTGSHDYATTLRKMAPNMLGVHKHVIDISFSPGWRAEWTEPALSLARKMILVVRLGNCLKSWRQEVTLHRDVSSTVCAAALQHGVVEWEELKRGDPRRCIERIETVGVSALGGVTVLDFLRDEMVRLVSEIEGVGELPFVDVADYARALRLVVEDQSRGESEAR